MILPQPNPENNPVAQTVAPTLDRCQGCAVGPASVAAVGGGAEVAIGMVASVAPEVDCARTRPRRTPRPLKREQEPAFLRSRLAEHRAGGVDALRVHNAARCLPEMGGRAVDLDLCAYAPVAEQVADRDRPGGGVRSRAVRSWSSPHPAAAGDSFRIHGADLRRGPLDLGEVTDEPAPLVEDQLRGRSDGKVRAGILPCSRRHVAL